MTSSTNESKSSTSYRKNSSNYAPRLLDHALLSLPLSTSVITSSLIQKEIFGKNKKIYYFGPKDIIPLCLLITTSTYIIDYLQTYEYMPQIFIFRLGLKKIYIEG